MKKRTREEKYYWPCLHRKRMEAQGNSNLDHVVESGNKPRYPKSQASALNVSSSSLIKADWMQFSTLLLLFKKKPCRGYLGILCTCTHMCICI